MSTISIMDGLVLTVVSMLTVFSVLTAIWGLVEVLSKVVQALNKNTAPLVPTAVSDSIAKSTGGSQEAQLLTTNEKNKQAAEIISLILASEDQPNKKYEIVDSKRVK